MYFFFFSTITELSFVFLSFSYQYCIYKLQLNTKANKNKLLWFQVEKSEYVFRPKSIQKMELLVLSLLDWKMNPVTPLSFMNHIIKMVPLGDHQHLEFSALFKHRVLSLLSDFKLVHYRPSVISAAVTLDVMKHMDFGGENLDSCKNELCGVLQFNKEKLEACYQLIQTSLANGNNY